MVLRIDFFKVKQCQPFCNIRWGEMLTILLVGFTDDIDAANECSRSCGVGRCLIITSPLSMMSSIVTLLGLRSGCCCGSFLVRFGARVPWRLFDFSSFDRDVTVPSSWLVVSSPLLGGTLYTTGRSVGLFSVVRTVGVVKIGGTTLRFITTPSLRAPSTMLAGIWKTSDKLVLDCKLIKLDV